MIDSGGKKKKKEEKGEVKSLAKVVREGVQRAADYTASAASSSAAGGSTPKIRPGAAGFDDTYRFGEQKRAQQEKRQNAGLSFKNISLWGDQLGKGAREIKSNAAAQQNRSPLETLMQGLTKGVKSTQSALDAKYDKEWEYAYDVLRSTPPPNGALKIVQDWHQADLDLYNWTKENAKKLTYGADGSFSAEYEKRAAEQTKKARRVLNTLNWYQLYYGKLPYETEAQAQEVLDYLNNWEAYSADMLQKIRDEEAVFQQFGSKEEYDQAMADLQKAEEYEKYDLDAAQRELEALTTERDRWNNPNGTYWDNRYTELYNYYYRQYLYGEEDPDARTAGAKGRRHTAGTYTEADREAYARRKAQAQIEREQGQNRWANPDRAATGDARIDQLNAEIGEVNYYRAMTEVYKKGNAARENADFEEYVTQGREALEAYANPDKTGKSRTGPMKLEISFTPTGDAGEQIRYANRIYSPYVEDNEREVLLYYYGKGDFDKFDEYYEALQPHINQRKGEETAAQLEGHAFLEYLYGAQSAASGFFENTGRAIASLAGNNEYSDYAPSAGDVANSLVRQDLEDNGHAVWAYDIMQNVVQNAVPVAAGTLANLLLPGSGAFVSSGLFATSIYGGAYDNMRQQRYTHGQAVTYAAITAGLEFAVGTALQGFAGLGKTTFSSFADVLTSKEATNGLMKAIQKFAGSRFGEYLGNMGSEFLEEGIQEFLDPFVNNLVEGKWDLETAQETFRNLDWMEILYAGFMGALNAGFMNSVSIAGGAGVEYMQDARRAKAALANGDLKTLVEIGLKYEEDSTAEYYATQLDDLMADGKADEFDPSGKVKRYTRGLVRGLRQGGETYLRDTAQSVAREALQQEKVTGRDLDLMTDIVTDLWANGVTNREASTRAQMKFGNLSGESYNGKSAERIINRVYKKMIDANGTMAAKQNEFSRGVYNDRTAAAGIDYAAEAAAQRTRQAMSTDAWGVDFDAVMGKVNAQNGMTPKRIARIADGKMYLENPDGRIVDSDNVTYKDVGTALAYEAVREMELDAQSANAVVKSMLIKAGGDSKSMSDQVVAMVQSYRAGLDGGDKVTYKNASAAAMDLVYEAGKKQRADVERGRKALGAYKSSGNKESDRAAARVRGTVERYDERLKRLEKARATLEKEERREPKPKDQQNEKAAQNDKERLNSERKKLKELNGQIAALEEKDRLTGNERRQLRELKLEAKKTQNRIGILEDRIRRNGGTVQAAAKTKPKQTGTATGSDLSAEERAALEGLQERLTYLENKENKTEADEREIRRLKEAITVREGAVAAAERAAERDTVDAGNYKIVLTAGRGFALQDKDGNTVQLEDVQFSGEYGEETKAFFEAAREKMRRTKDGIALSPESANAALAAWLKTPDADPEAFVSEWHTMYAAGTAGVSLTSAKWLNVRDHVLTDAQLRAAWESRNGVIDGAGVQYVNDKTLTAAQDGALRAVDAAAKKYGLRVVVADRIYSGGRYARDYGMRDGKTLVLALETETGKATAETILNLTFYHEAFHALGQMGKSGKEFRDSITKVVLDYLKETMPEAEYEALFTQRERAYGSDRALLREEIAAQYLGTLMAQKDAKDFEAALQNAINAADKTFLEKFADRLKAFLAELREAIKNLAKRDRAVAAALEADVKKAEEFVLLLDRALQLAAAEEEDGEKNTAGDGGVKHSKELTKITINSTEIERENILRKKESFVAAEYKGQAEYFIKSEKEDLEKRKKTAYKKVYQRAINELGLPSDLYNEDMHVKLQISSGTFEESSSKETASAEDIIRLIPIVEDTVRSAVGIEVHTNRYFSDNHTIYFANLLGGYIDGDDFVPIRFGIKAGKTGEHTLYVVIGDKRIKKSEVFTTIAPQKDGATVARSDFNISIARLAEKVNNKKILQYLPDGLLSEQQKSIKWKAIAESIKKTNKKNDTKYFNFIKKGNIRAAEQMVKEAAKRAGYVYSLYHQTDADFNIFDTHHEGAGNRDNETPWGIFMKSTADNIGVKGTRQMQLYAKLKTPLSVQNRAELVQRLQAMSQEFAAAYQKGKEIDRTYKKKMEDADAAWKQYLQDHPLKEGQTRKSRYEDPEFMRLFDAEHVILEEWTKEQTEQDRKTKDIIVSALKKNGYDSVILAEDQGSWGRKTDAYIALDPEQVKSAAPITYDDDGNVIPISERFNESESDIRFSKNLDAAAEERDKTYLAAVENGDTKTAQRMVDEAAKRAGYTMHLYHGSRKGGGIRIFKNWQYFTESKAYAERYMQRDNADSLYDVYVKAERMFDTRRPECRKLFEQFREEYGMSPIQASGLPDWTDGYDLSDIIEENDLPYDGIVLDEGGDKTENGPVSRGPSYVIRESNQVKRADAITYDADGNVIPISQRFDEKEKDINFSKNLDAVAEERLEAESEQRDEVLEQTEILRERAGRLIADADTPADVARLLPGTRQITELLKKRNFAAADYKRLTEMAGTVHRMLENLYTGRTGFASFMLDLQNLLRHEIENAGHWEDAGDGSVQDFKKQVHGAKIYLNPDIYTDVAESFGGARRLRNAVMGKFWITNDAAKNGQGLDTFYDELQRENYGLPETTDPTEQIQNILNLYNSGNKVWVDDATQLDWFGETAAAVARDEAMKLFGELTEATPRAKKTSADRVASERIATISQQIMAERRAEREAALREAMEIAANKTDKLKKDADYQIAKARIEAEERVKAAQKLAEQRVRDAEVRLEQQKKSDKLKAEIRRKVRAISKLLIRNENYNNIPDAAKKSVMGLMKLFQEDRDIYSKEEVSNVAFELGRILKGLETADFGDEDGEGFDAFAARLDTAIAGEAADMLDTLAAQGGETGRIFLRHLTVQQAETVLNALDNISFAIRNANLMRLGERQENAAALGQQAVRDLNAAKPHKVRGQWSETVHNYLDTKMLTPIYFFNEKLGGVFGRLFGDFLDGQDSWAEKNRAAKAFMQETMDKYHYDAWKKDAQTFSFTSADVREPWRVTLTVGSMMEIYAWKKREESSGQESSHLLTDRTTSKTGGVVLSDALEKEQKKYAKKHAAAAQTGQKKNERYLKFLRGRDRINDAVVDKNRHKLTAGDIQMVIDSLTDEQKAYVDAVVNYMSTVTSGWGNDATRKQYGIRKFTEGYYFPYETPKEFTNRRFGLADDTRLKNWGSAQRTVRRAHTPLVLGDFTEVAVAHMQEMALYSSFLTPLENMQTVYNYREQDGVTSVAAAMTNAYGKAATEYISQFLTAINGGLRSDSVDDVYNRLTGKFKAAAVMANASVVIQQPTAIMRATAIINPKYFFGVAKKSDYNEMLAHCPTAVVKEMGGFDTAMGVSAAEWILDRPKPGRRIGDALGWGAEKADAVTWTNIWNAVKRETRDKTDFEEGSDEFWDACNKRFREIANYTQVYDSALSKSELMRSKAGLAKMVTAFMAEPTLSYNLVVMSGKNRTISKSRALAAFVLNVIVNAAFQSVVGAWRDKDENKTYWEKWMKRFAGNTIGSADTWFMDSALNPLGLVPYVKDLISIFAGWDVERSDVSVFGELIQSGKRLVDSIFEGKFTTEKLLTFLGAVSSLTPVPMKSVYKDVTGIWRTVKQGGDKEYKTTASTVWSAFLEGIGLSGDKGDRIYNAFVTDDTEMQRRLRDGYKTEDSYRTAVRKALRDNDERIRAAAEAKLDGRAAEYQRLVDEILAEGHFEKEDVMKALDAEYKAVKEERNPKQETEPETDVGTEEDAAGYGSGKADAYYAVAGGNEADVQAVYEDLIAGGKTEKEAGSTVRTGVHEAYVDGSIDRKTAEAYVKKYSDKTEDEIYWDFDKWDYQIEHGSDDGYRKYAAFDKAVETGKNLEREIQRYLDHGVTAKTLAGKITEDFKEQYRNTAPEQRDALKNKLLDAYEELGYDRYKKSKDIDDWLD